jgi:hypothetical protein
MAGQAISNGSLVWIEDETEAWTEGEVISVMGDQATVKTASRTVRNPYTQSFAAFAYMLLASQLCALSSAGKWKYAVVLRGSSFSLRICSHTCVLFLRRYLLP